MMMNRDSFLLHYLGLDCKLPSIFQLSTKGIPKGDRKGGKQRLYGSSCFVSFALSRYRKKGMVLHNSFLLLDRWIKTTVLLLQKRH